MRQYVKSLHDKADYRSEESLTLNHLLLKEALANIRYPDKNVSGQMKSTDKASKDSGSSGRRAEVDDACLSLS